MALAQMPAGPNPILRRFGGDRILGAALLISLAVHALALLPTFSPAASGGKVALRATVHGPSDAPSKPAVMPAALDEPKAPTQAAPLPEPIERTYQRAGPATESAEAPAADGTLPADVASPLPALRPAIDVAGLNEYHAALGRVAARFWNYPKQAHDAGWEGLVAMRLSVSEAGVPIGIELIGSSGFPILDRAALETMSLAASHTPVPESLRGRPFNIDLAATYKRSVAP